MAYTLYLHLQAFSVKTLSNSQKSAATRRSNPETGWLMARIRGTRRDDGASERLR